MSQPHVIRLRGPWEYEPLARWVALPAGIWREETGGLPPAGRVTLPSDWGSTLGASFRGIVRYRRRFHCPTGLHSGTSVWLVVDRVDARGRTSLNGEVQREIDEDRPSIRFDVSSALLPNNELVVEVELPPWPVEIDRRLRGERAGLPGGLVGEVRLEIFDESALGTSYVD